MIQVKCVSRFGSKYQHICNLKKSKISVDRKDLVIYDNHAHQILALWSHNDVTIIMLLFKKKNSSKIKK